MVCLFAGAYFEFREPLVQCSLNSGEAYKEEDVI